MNTLCTKIPTNMAAGAVRAVTKRAFQTSIPSVSSGGGLDVTFKTNAKPTMFTSYDFGMTKAKSVHNTKAKAIHSAPKLEANAIYEQENSMDTTVIDPTILLRQKLASRGFENIFKAPNMAQELPNPSSSDSVSTCTNCHRCPNAATCPMATNMR